MMTKIIALIPGLILAGTIISVPPQRDRGRRFPVIETTIAEIHNAYRSGRLTCRRLVETYLRRIARYDKTTKLNAIVVLNPDALKTAEVLDLEFRTTKTFRPLHGIPVIVKDNYDTKDMQTTGGSEALKGFVPPDDAFLVKRLREAGAVILAKSNMGEWAFSPLETQSSIAGITRNPYDLNRVPAGSSGGTAAAVAANFGAVGMGTDTGNSIRGPSSHCDLVGLRPTIGLTSRAGIIPLYLRNDVGGPMCRTVEDTARVLDAIAGYDQADPVTALGKDKIPPTYTASLDRGGANGARFGVFRYYMNRRSTDPEISALFEKAINDLKALGAVIVDPFEIPRFRELTNNIWRDVFQRDVDVYFASLGNKAPVKNILDVYNSGKFSPAIRERLYRAVSVRPEEAASVQDVYHEPRNVVFRDAVLKAMRDQNVDFIVYPTWSNPPRFLGDEKSPAGDNSQLIPPHTGMPAISVPMGFSHRDCPAGLQIVARLFAEPDLLKVAYAYEQATRYRRPPRQFNR